MSKDLEMNRQAVIADAAIGIVATNGVRALTHRAVDRAAGFPEGTTSNHARTRHALLTMVVDRLAERASADSAAADTAGAAGNVDELASVLSALVDALVRRLEDMRARFALILELDDLPELKMKLTTESDVHRTNRNIARRLLAGAGLSASDRDVEQLLTLTDSLVFARTAGLGAIDPERIFAAYLRGSAVLSDQSEAAPTA